MAKIEDFLFTQSHNNMIIIQISKILQLYSFHLIHKDKLISY